MSTRLQALTAKWCQIGIHPVVKYSVVEQRDGQELIQGRCDYCGRVESEGWRNIESDNSRYDDQD